MRNRIWIELTQAKFYVEFTSLYCDRQRSILRYFNLGVLAFSTGGVMGWAFWGNMPLVACCIISTISLLRLVQPQLIMSDKQIQNLDSIYKFYFDYYNKLERLWFDFEHGAIDSETAKAQFFEIKDSEGSINAIVNETVRTKPNSLIKRAKCYSDEYFKLSFNT